MKRSHTRPLPRFWFTCLKGAACLGALAFSGFYHPAQAQTTVPQVGALIITAAPHPYAAPDTAPKAVEDAFATAQKTGRNVLLEFGANWCPDCRVLAGVLANPHIAPWVEQNFVETRINVDHFNQNMAIAQHYGITIKAIPVALVVTPQGKVLNPEATLELGNARTLSAQAVVDKLAEWLKRS